jgi:hypothetical protein
MQPRAVGALLISVAFHKELANYYSLASAVHSRVFYLPA